ncbi:MAG: hypothetical protein IT270_15000, partial [Saprospiraceae bacterium]|nr:hypothetical protein [Saprospiraceae bacterium]
MKTIFFSQHKNTFATMFTKTIYVLLLALGLSTGAMAQGGNPCLPDLVDQIQAELID